MSQVVKPGDVLHTQNQQSVRLGSVLGEGGEARNSRELASDLPMQKFLKFARTDTTNLHSGLFDDIFYIKKI